MCVVHNALDGRVESETLIIENETSRSSLKWPQSNDVQGN